MSQQLMSSKQMRQIQTTRRIPYSFILIALLPVIGCAQEKPLEIHPVRGKVTVRGRPAAGAEIGMHRSPPVIDAEGRELFPSAIAADDGTFQVTTYQPNDGAPEGVYKVTVTWPTITVEAGEKTYGLDQLAGRFAKPEKPAATITVKPGENVLPDIALK